MKRMISIVLATLLSVTLGSTALAQDVPVDDTQNVSVSQLNNPYPEYGDLIEYVETDNHDGTYSKEYTYIQEGPSLYSNSYGTDTYTKVKQYIGSKTGELLCEYQVTGTFKWDLNSRKVTVSNVKGAITKKDNAKYSSGSTSTRGNGTSKASGTYKFTRTTRLGSVTALSVTVSCNYKGVNS